MVKTILKSLLKGVLIGLVLGALLWLISWNWVFSLFAGIFAVAITMAIVLIVTLLFKHRQIILVGCVILAILVIGYLIGIVIGFDEIYICKNTWEHVFVNAFGGAAVLWILIMIWGALQGLFIDLVNKASRRRTVWLCCQWLLSFIVGAVLFVMVK